MEIHCTACGQTALVRTEAVYEDFTKIGETYFCTACGHRYASRAELSVAEREARPRVFDDAAHLRACRHCRHYVVNPFTEYCGKHQRETHATECCDDFAAKPQKSGGDPLASLFDA